MSPLSGVLNEAWTLYKRFFSHFVIISFVIYLVIAVVTALLSLAAGSWGAFFGGLLSLFGLFLLQAALVKAAWSRNTPNRLRSPPMKTPQPPAASVSSAVTMAITR